MEKKEYPPFSVAMSVYKSDDPCHFREALDSVFSQSLPADEVHLTVDGPVSDELNAIIEEYKNRYETLTVDRLEVNIGLGNVLRRAMEKCKYDLIFRMDSDDISAPGRFKKQMDAYLDEPADVLGCSTVGFVGDLETTTKVSLANRRLTHEEIIKTLPNVCPMSHVTVLLRREAVLKAGSYLHCYHHEDYFLWTRMAKAGCKFRNIPEHLVYVRLGEEQARRHGGWKYFKAECVIRRYMLKHHLATVLQVAKALAIRFVYQLLLTPSLRNTVSIKYKRKYVTREEVDRILKKNIEEAVR